MVNENNFFLVNILETLFEWTQKSGDNGHSGQLKFNQNCLAISRGLNNNNTSGKSYTK